MKTKLRRALDLVLVFVSLTFAVPAMTFAGVAVGWSLWFSVMYALLVFVLVFASGVRLGQLAREREGRIC